MKRCSSFSVLRAAMTLLVILFCALPALADNSAKVVKSSDEKTLTFYYDDATHTEGSQVYTDLSNYTYWPDWANNSNITTVVFDSSFADACPTTTYRWFKDLKNLTTITGIEYFNTSEVKNMSSMFFGCESLTTLDLSGFDTEQVTDMSYMFEGCKSLTSLDLSAFNTAEVKSMTYMFYNCKSLTTLDLKTFNTGEVKNMSEMFKGCKSLTTLDLKTFNTAAVTNMSNMFDGCGSLTTLDLSKFNTSKVTDMNYMFNDCSSLTTLDLSKFNTSKVTDMTYMFQGCSSLTTLDVSRFNTTNVTDIHNMFKGCSSLTTLDLNSFNTAAVTNMSYMFDGCGSLTTLDLSSFNTAEVVNMAYMFQGCGKLKTIYASFSTGNVTSSTNMFYGCTSLVGGKGTTCNGTDNIDATYARIDGGTDSPGYFTYDLNGYAILSGTTLTFYASGQTPPEGSYSLNSGTTDPDWISNKYITTVVFDPSFHTTCPTTTYKWFSGLESLTTITGLRYLNTSAVKNMNRMFSGCKNLQSLDVSSFNTSAVKDMAFMFSDCKNLQSLDVSSFNTTNVIYAYDMFNGCSSLTTLDVSRFNTTNVTDIHNMFSGCKSLTTLDLSNFNTAKVQYMNGMFESCKSLTTLDLSSFNTEKVTLISDMFKGCSNLKTIIACDKFTTNKAISNIPSMDLTEGMFSGCTSLVGGNGTTCNGTDNINGIYARIDGGPDSYTPGYFTDKSSVVTLANSADNSFTITNNTGTKNVLLSGRTLYRDGYWNTLCLPFGVNLSDTKSPLYGAVAMSLNSASFEASTGTLTLDFESVSTLTAGTPYIIKWEDSDNTLPDLVNPVFQGVSIAGTTLNPVTKSDANGEVITFTGTYNYQKFSADDRSILFMGAENTLYYPQSGAEIGACRAYFQLADGLTAGEPAESIKAFVLNFDEESTSIRDVLVSERKDDGWYTLDGVKFTNRPTKKGIYVRNGKKVVIK